MRKVCSCRFIFTLNSLPDRQQLFMELKLNDIVDNDLQSHLDTIRKGQMSLETLEITLTGPSWIGATTFPHVRGSSNFLTSFVRARSGVVLLSNLWFIRITFLNIVAKSYCFIMPLNRVLTYKIMWYFVNYTERIIIINPSFQGRLICQKKHNNTCCLGNHVETETKSLIISDVRYDL